MAIIKCPECGKDVSDKAPFCPHCGVKIAGELPVPVPQPNPKKASHGHKTLLVSFIVAVIVCGIGVLVYQVKMGKKENEAYAMASSSADTLIMQSYLERYPHANETHRQEVMDLLEKARKMEKDWNNAKTSNSLSEIKDFLSTYPNSAHRQAAEERIDSLSWAMAKNKNTPESYNQYIGEFPEGAYIDQAQDALRKRLGQQVQPEEREMVRALFRKFFQSVNSRNEDAMLSTCEDILTNFLGKSTATKSDVASFMQKIYKPEITNMNWYLDNDYAIKKREVGDLEYEYQVTFSAKLEREYSEKPKEESRFRVAATVSPDGKISSLNLTKILQPE